MTRQARASAVGIGLAAVILIVGALVWRASRPAPKRVLGGSIPLELDGGDRQFLDGLREVPAPQAADPAFGGSGIDQSPSYDMETWRTLLQDDLR